MVNKELFFIDDGVNAVKALCRDPRLLPGAGATEMALAVKLRKLSESCAGLDQYAIKKVKIETNCSLQNL